MAYEMTAAEAASRLGVKQATLYAYVSRGVLSRGRASDGRASLFDPREVEELARRGRPRRPAGVTDIIIESQITEIAGDQLRYRGRNVIDLATTRRFEDVAELLWAGALPPAGATPVPWRCTDAALRVGRAAQSALPLGTLPLERLQVIVPAIAATDPLRPELDPAAVMAAGRAIIAAMVRCLPTAGPASDEGPGMIAVGLWGRLCERRPNPALLRALSAALVLLADHELAASTLAVRAAASVRADPYAVVATGLGAISGALHGGSSLGAETLLAAARGPADISRVVAELRRRGEKIPGFGHLVYRSGDPRAIALLDLIRRAAPKSTQLAIADALLAEVRQKSLPEPNIDIALATLVRVAGMVRGAGEAIFAIARTAGWIAHALEAYTTAPIRPRAIYTGPGAIDS
ncbi:MAG TPA: citrate/2-methylcitrate synthase [Streptosporangiaceae bacterium]